MMSIPTDCPQRDERQGWTADAHLTSDEAIHNFFMPAFYENWMELMTDDQFNGALCEIIPCWPGIGRRPGDPAWTAAYYIIHYNLYKYYGATRYLEAHYNVMKSNIAFFQEYLKDNGGLSAMYVKQTTLSITSLI
jgi:alpha-L-rhamnosidase